MQPPSRGWKARKIGPQVLGPRIADVPVAGAKRRGELCEVVGVSRKGVFGATAFGRDHIEEEFDQRLVGSFALRGHDDQGCLANLSGGIVTVISRGLGSNQVASMNMPPYTRPPRTPMSVRNRNRLGIVGYLTKIYRKSWRNLGHAACMVDARQGWSGEPPSDHYLMV
jgi:hypothetical protein